MPKIDVTKTELVWPGKYNKDGTLKEVKLGQDRVLVKVIGIFGNDTSQGYDVKV